MDKSIFGNLMDNQNSNNDFGKLLGFKLTDYSEGYAKGELILESKHFNVIKSVHGGCLFAIADSTAGAVSYTYGERCATLNCAFNYLKPVMEGSTKKLISEAKIIKNGKRVKVVGLEMFDDSGDLVCQGTFTYMTIGIPVKI